MSTALGEEEQHLAELYARECSGCHDLPDPDSLTAEMWVENIDEMAPLTDISDESQLAALLSYLQSRAGSLEHVIEKKHKYYERFCSDCHNVSSAPETELADSRLVDFIMDHLIEEADLDIEEGDANKVAEYILLTSTF